MKGRVLCVTGLQCLIEAEGRDWTCQLRGRLKRGRRQTSSPVVAGDWVEFSSDLEGSDGVVEQVHERRSKISRASVGGKTYEQIFAANVDQCIVVVSACQPALRPGFIDRAIVATLLGNAEPVICINKIDLAQGDLTEIVAELYRGLGYHVVMTSASTAAGTGALKELLVNKTSAFMGQSGVGKSSILNCIEPGLGIRTNELMAKHDRGRHTTTATQLHRLEGGIYVADTPGIKRLQPYGLEPSEVVDYFVEMSPLTDDCQYRDCLHLTEPRCAVRVACEMNQIDSLRYDSYRRFMEDL
jgi:ribosome biogenesis GTPase